MTVSTRFVHFDFRWVNTCAPHSKTEPGWWRHRIPLWCSGVWRKLRPLTMPPQMDHACCPEAIPAHAARVATRWNGSPPRHCIKCRRTWEQLAIACMRSKPWNTLHTTHLGLQVTSSSHPRTPQKATSLSSHPMNQMLTSKKKLPHLHLISVCLVLKVKQLWLLLVLSWLQRPLHHLAVGFQENARRMWLLHR